MTTLQAKTIPLQIKCCKCGQAVGVAMIPTNLRDLLPIQYRAVLSFLPPGSVFELDPTVISDALNIECVNHSTKG